MSKRVVERSKIPSQYKWRTTDLFSSDQAWEKEKKKILKELPKLEKFSGTLKKGGKKKILACLRVYFAIEERLAKFNAYASRKNDEDTRKTKYQAMRDVAEKVSADVRAAQSFLEPELLTLSAKDLNALIVDTTFKDFSRSLSEIARQKAHILSAKEEAILASASLMRDAGHTIYSAFCGAELRFGKIKDEKGKSVEVNQANFSHYRASNHRKVRKAAFDSFMGSFESYRGTFASMLSSQVNANIVYAKARGYDSALHGAVDPDELSVDVYQMMLKEMGRGRKVLQRYLNLRKRLLKLKELNYYDLYAPANDQVKLKYPYPKAAGHLLAALQPMTKRYLDPLKVGLDPKNGWIDPYPNLGKRSGAYMDGSAYDVHPFVLGNYLDDYNSLSMLAHEMGHAMHSYFSNRRQPYAKADYSIFIAEIASTLNEALLADYMIDKEKNIQKKRYLLGEKLEGFRQTMFRQAMFAEFEAKIYQRAEAKEALSADILSEDYLMTARKIYGHKEGVVKIDDAYGIEWAYIPHFYYNFYVFQYVTGMTAAIALAEKIKTEGKVAAERYIDALLCAGCSAAPLEILKNAGVDLTTPEPYRIAMRAFNATIAELEQH